MSPESQFAKPDADWWAGIVDCLMASGDRLAEQLRNPNAEPDSPWTLQVLEGWAEAKNITEWLPEQER